MSLTSLFARRVYLDVWGLLPTPDELQRVPRPIARRPSARRSSRACSPTTEKYADHWISFWNDLLRNEDGVTYFSETAGRKSITDWLLPGAAVSNLPYDQFVRRLLNPAVPADPEGFLDRRELARRDERRGDAVDAGVAEHGAGLSRRQSEVQRLPRQLRQQVEAEGRLRARRRYFSPEARLQLYRCDVAQNRYAEPAFLFRS